MVFIPQAQAEVERALYPAVVARRQHARCASCSIDRLCVCLDPRLCEGCASSLESNLGVLPLRVLRDARELALHCLRLPPRERAPVLAVLQVLGVPPYHITVAYPRLEVSPTAHGIAARPMQVEDLAYQSTRVFEKWHEVLEFARKLKAAIQWPLAECNGVTPYHLEHLVGAPQPSLVWTGTPFELAIVEVRPNCVVMKLRTDAGDATAYAPDVLRYLLNTSRHFGVMVLASGGRLMATRRGVNDPYSGDTRAAFEATVKALADYRLITPMNERRIRAEYPWHFRTEVADDLGFALETLSPHESCTVETDTPYATMRRLAPALIAVGLVRRLNSGMSFALRDQGVVHPWVAALRAKTLRAVVEYTHTLRQ